MWLLALSNGCFAPMAAVAGAGQAPYKRSISLAFNSGSVAGCSTRKGAHVLASDIHKIQEFEVNTSVFMFGECQERLISAYRNKEPELPLKSLDELRDSLRQHRAEANVLRDRH